MTSPSRTCLDGDGASAAGPPNRQGWDQATFRCGLCGAERTATTEDDYVQTVGAHRDAHVVFDRLNPIERDGFASILRIILADLELAAELLALIERQDQLSASDTSPTNSHDDPQKER